jgi:hypothetical protein
MLFSDQHDFQANGAAANTISRDKQFIPATTAYSLA